MNSVLTTGEVGVNHSPWNPKQLCTALVATVSHGVSETVGTLKPIDIVALSPAL